MKDKLRLRKLLNPDICCRTCKYDISNPNFKAGEKWCEKHPSIFGLLEKYNGPVCDYYEEK